MRSTLQSKALHAHAGRLELVVYLVDQAVVFPLPERGSVSLGRSSDNSVRIEDGSVSRRHAILHIGDELRVEDLGSANGSRVRTPQVNAKADTDGRGSGQCFSFSIGDTLVFGSVFACVRPVQNQEANLAPPSQAGVERTLHAPCMCALYEEAKRAAQSDLSILILGETGVGKEVLARYIHQASARASGPFVVVHAAALGESLLEGELFGHEKGAFTGATMSKPGLFEAAHGGTVFLDEIGEVSPSVQVKLLRVLEERAILRIGARSPRPIDIRFLAATHRDLEAEVGRGSFREDFYYRLNGIAFTVPPLRERRVEIPAMAEAFVKASSQRLGRSPIPALSPELMDTLLRHGWPGNVRELRQAMERAVVMAGAGPIRLEHLPPRLAALGGGVARERVHSIAPPASSGVFLKSSTSDFPGQDMGEEPKADTCISALDFEGAVKALDRRRIEEALRVCGGNQSKAALMLGISRRSLVSKLEAYVLPRPRKGRGA